MFINFIFFTGCQKQEQKFNYESLQELKETARSYSEFELQNGEVPLNEYISLTGKIITSDSYSEDIKKGDRFVLKSGYSEYQVFNEQEMSLKIGDNVKVYGEYYGFLKAILIERIDKND